MPASTPYIARAADQAIQRGLRQFRCVRLFGPRSIGKTTTARRHTVRHFDLSDEFNRGRLTANAGALLREGPFPVLIDEWQAHPDVLWDVKRVIDERPESGLFIVAGSMTWHPSERNRSAFPLTGRTVDVEMRPLSVSEKLGRGGPNFLTRLFDAAHARREESGAAGDRVRALGGELDGSGYPVERGDARDDEVRGLLDRALDSGYPDLAGKPAGEQRDGNDAIINAVSGLDVARLVNREKLRAFLQACAVHSSKPVALETLIRQADVARKTGESYRSALADVGLTYSLPRWRGSVRGDARKRSRHFMADPSLVAHLTDADPERVLRDSQFLGALMETFVATQLRAEAAAANLRFKLSHYADPLGEVDLVVEDIETDQFALIEVKTRGQARIADTKHMVRVRDSLESSGRAGPAFAAGVVLYTGGRYGYLGETNLFACPISALWRS